MKTRDDHREYVKNLTDEELSELLGEIHNTEKIVLVAEWYTKKHIKQKLNSYPDIIRDFKIEEALGEEITFDIFYTELCMTTQGETSYIVGDDFNEYTFPDFIDKWNDEDEYMNDEYPN
jgi:hypothetical protein